MAAVDNIVPQPGPPEVARLTEHLFREEAGKLVSALTRVFGIERLQLAEDVVQEAMIRALQTWPYRGIPENPAAWLMQTAKNLALDHVRRESNFRDKQSAVLDVLEQVSPATQAEKVFYRDEIRDDQLRLMFACCHPEIPQDDQTALALKTLCGFSPREIASAFLATEAAITKRLTRARQRIRDAGIRFEIPAGADASQRLDGVLQILYLLFNEGYKASSGEQLLREDLCHEAIRLAALLAEHPATNQPRTHALLAMMLLHTARMPGRTDGDGSVLRLEEQDRSKWNRELIMRGLIHIGQAAVGTEVTEFHLQAGIAACHATAPDYKSTDWKQILFLYDQWTRLNSSPVVALNRAVAVAEVNGAAAGLDAVNAIPNQRQLQDYYLAYAVRGDLEARLNHNAAAIRYFEKAMQLTSARSEQAFLAKRRQECNKPAPEA